MSRTFTSTTSNDGSKRHRRAKSTTLKSRRQRHRILVFGAVALLLSVPLAIHLWQTARPMLQAWADGSLEKSRLQRAEEVGDMKETGISGEPSSEAAGPFAVLYPADVPFATAMSEEELAEVLRKPRIRRMRARLNYLKEMLVVFRTEPSVAMYEPGAVENAVVVVLGNSGLSATSIQTNKLVERALMQEARRNRVVLSKQRLRTAFGEIHRYAHESATKVERGRLVIVPEGTCKRQNPVKCTSTFLPKEDPEWNVQEVGAGASLVFLDKLKLDFTPYRQPFNGSLLYLIAPSEGAEDDHYFAAYRRGFLNAILLVNAYNKRTSDAPLTRIIVPPLWEDDNCPSHRAYPLALDCMKTLRYAANKHLTAGLTVEFLGDKNSLYLAAARELEDKVRSVWWS